MSKRLVVFVCLVIALAGGFALLARRGSPGRNLPAQNAALIFCGFTNLPAGSFAAFCLSNGTAAHFACVPEAFEQANAQGWLRAPLTTGSRRGPRDWMGVPEELSPGQAATFLVPPPASNGAWRLVLLCQEQARLVDPVTDTVRHLTDSNATATQLRQFSGRRYFVTSPAIAP